MDRVATMTNLNPETVSRWFRIWRRCMAIFLNGFETQTQIGGPGAIVEIDESSFSAKTKYNRGRRNDTRWVFGMVERVDENGVKSEKKRFFVVDDRTRATLLPIILRNVAAGTTIMSDSYGPYHNLGAFNGFIHRMVNHSAEFVNSVTGAHTQKIEGAWKHAKEALKQDGGTRRKYIQERLDEFVFRSTWMRASETRFHVLGRLLAKHGVLAARQCRA